MPADCCVETLLKMLKPENRGEPVFLLLARDKTGPDTIMKWLCNAEAVGVSAGKLERARQHLDAFIEWQRENPGRVKVPD